MIGRILFLDRLDAGTVELWADCEGFELFTFDRHRDYADRHGQFDRLSDAILAALSLAVELREADRWITSVNEV
jgi:rRNA maturation endonuclease Nob1